VHLPAVRAWCSFFFGSSGLSANQPDEELGIFPLELRLMDLVQVPVNMPVLGNHIIGLAESKAGQRRV
jgi:hypothetical protein